MPTLGAPQQMDWQSMVQSQRHALQTGVKNEVYRKEMTCCAFPVIS